MFSSSIVSLIIGSGSFVFSFKSTLPDIVIVGSGILKADDPVAAAKVIKEALK
jgi:3-keto-L-gulonate-6-phosphate decarboxylase